MESAAGGSRVDSGAGPRGRRPWAGRRILLGVTGGIAAYKSVQLARDLAQYGALVDTVLTRAAREFVGAVSFEALTGRTVHTDLWTPGEALSHIRLARAADVVVVAPATADFMASAAAGRAHDLLAAILLATRAPVLLCPAMNDYMWSHPQTRLNARHLHDQLGYELVGPAEGPLAFGEGEGAGRMEDVATIFEYVGRALGRDARFAGRRIVVTAGPTREAVDPVRVLTNRSSGRMGFALAAAAWRRGADVTLIAGPSAVEPPRGPHFIAVETAEEMLVQVRRHLANADALLMAAAVADFRPASPANAKIKKSGMPSALELEAAPDVLAETRTDRPAGCFVVGFALETDNGLEQARAKLERKDLDLIVLNDVREPGAGFDVDTNRVTLIPRRGEPEVLPLLPKTEVAEQLLDRVAAGLRPAS